MKYKTGDLVRIRQWDDMAEEFGVAYGSIKIKFGFTNSMRQLCGKVFTVEYVDGDGCVYGHKEDWTITEDMLESVSQNMVDFEDACKPLVAYLEKYGNPHSMAVVEIGSARLYSGEIGIPFPVKD